MKLHDLVTTSNRVAEVSGRLEKIDRLASLLSRLTPEEVDTAIAFLTGSPRQGRIGVGGAALRGATPDVAASSPTLELLEVDQMFERVAKTTGRGSVADRAGLVRNLFERATREEQDFLARLFFGELRQGALEGVLVEAVARAAKIPAAQVRRALMMAGELGPVARATLGEGEAGLARFLVRPFQPIKPMLADSADSIEEALERLGETAALEHKLDGARIQVHKAGEDVMVFSRQLREVTGAVPEVVQMARALPTREIILDGEAIALRADGTPLPFQITMRRFGRKLDVEQLRDELPLTPFLFDCLYLDGESLIDEPQSRRVEALARIVPSHLLVPRVVAVTRTEAVAFLEDALRRGHEGVMAKAPESTYAAGRRGQTWLKIKMARSLDLVVLAAEWGHGRRKGWLSNLHLGARDPDRSGFVMLGKTFKGLTDEMLAWQTRRFLELEIGRDEYTVYLRPEVVVEIAFNEIQESPHYPGGLALRFARVKGYRPDKSAAEADTIGAVQEIYRRMTGSEPPAPRHG